jgi:hypothetical protein
MAQRRRKKGKSKSEGPFAPHVFAPENGASERMRKYQRHLPTPESRATVKARGALGWTHEVIADYLGITRKVLERKYYNEVRMGRRETAGIVMRTFVHQAAGGPEGDWRKAIPQQTRAYIEMFGPDGSSGTHAERLARIKAADGEKKKVEVVVINGAKQRYPGDPTPEEAAAMTPQEETDGYFDASDA